MLENASKLAKYMISVFVGLTLFGVFFPLIQTAVDGLGLDNITLFGTSYDWSWAGYLIVLAIVLILVFSAVNQISKSAGGK